MYYFGANYYGEGRTASWSLQSIEYPPNLIGSVAHKCVSLIQDKNAAKMLRLQFMMARLLKLFKLIDIEII